LLQETKENKATVTTTGHGTNIRTYENVYK